MDMRPEAIAIVGNIDRETYKKVVQTLREMYLDETLIVIDDYNKIPDSLKSKFHRLNTLECFDLIDNRSFFLEAPEPEPTAKEVFGGPRRFTRLGRITR